MLEDGEDPVLPITVGDDRGKGAGSDVHSAGRFDPLTVDPAGIFGTEEGDYAADIFGDAGAAEGGDAADTIFWSS